MKVTIQTNSDQFEFDCAPGESMLAAGLRNGITIPYECATGTCGTCRGRVMEGDVLMAWEDAPGTARLKREKGDCLLCQTSVTSDVLVRVPSQKVSDRFDKTFLPEHSSGRITGMRRLTHDVVHFELETDRPLSFDAGQFAILQCQELTGARAYSMVNYALATSRLEFVVKRLPGGGFSDWLFDGSPEGATLQLFGPLGAATFHPEEDRNLLCIAGGSGIAGMMSIIGRACQDDHFRSHRGHVFFGVRTVRDYFYLEELAEFVRRGGSNLEVTIVLSDEDPGTGTHPDFPELKLDTGFVHEAASRSMVGRYDNVIGYVAGPPPMVDASLRILRTEGNLSVSDIRYDKFS